MRFSPGTRRESLRQLGALTRSAATGPGALLRLEEGQRAPPEAARSRAGQLVLAGQLDRARPGVRADRQDRTARQDPAARRAPPRPLAALAPEDRPGREAPAVRPARSRPRPLHGYRSRSSA